MTRVLALAATANDLGSGYGSMAVAGDRVFLQGARGGNSMVIALNRADGKEVWSKALGPVETKMRSDRGGGPRGTPTVDGDRLYVLTENGDLACLKTDGTAVWQINILKDFGGPQLQWLISESPLIDGPHLVVTPGGPGAGMVKLDKMTGKTVWTAKELKMMWRDRSVGKGSVTYADGRLYIQSETNMVGLAEATPSGYSEKGRFEIPDKGMPSWAHPVISDGRLYVRNQDTLLVCDIKAAR
jgi:outer membrane protein assembly factor BamB